MSDFKDENLTDEEIQARIKQLMFKPQVPPPRHFKIQGKVIKINKPLLFFDILTQSKKHGEHCARIYVPFYCDIDQLVFFPKIGDSIKITKMEYMKGFSDIEKDNNNKDKSVYKAIGVINQEATFEIESQSEDECDNNFLYFLVEYEINEEELIMIDKYIIRIVECFIREGEDQLLLIKAIYKELGWDDILRKDFSILVRLPIDLKYVNTKYDTVYSALNFDPPSALNVYPSRTNKKIMKSPGSYRTVAEFLVGTLVVPPTGQFILKAYSSNIVVKFMDTSGSVSLNEIDKALVIIKKYIVFIEIFTVPSYPPLIYVVVDPEDVVIVKPYFELFTIENRRLFKIGETLPKSFKYKHQMEILKKSDVIIGYKHEKEIWIEALVKTFCSNEAMKALPQMSFSNKQNNNYHKAFIIITGDLIKLAPILKQRQVYFYYTNIPFSLLQIYDVRELKALHGTSNLYYVPPDALFQETDVKPEVTEFIYQDMTVPLLRSTMQAHPSKMISFEIRVSKKTYHIPPPSFKSWYPKRQILPFFGDIDNYQQRIMFYDDETNQYTDLYLSNRENLAFPCGLVNDMKIRVNHVLINKGKYLKSTPFTTFDILGYHPENNYTCANLAVTNGKWNFRASAPSLFGSDYRLTTNTIIHGKVIFRAIYDLSIEVICGNCNNFNYRKDGCMRCDSWELDASVSIVFNAADASTRQHFKMQTNSLDFLLDIININPKQKDMFLRAMQRYGPVSFNLLKVPPDYKDPKSIIVETMISKLRDTINFKRPIMINIVAMKVPPSTGQPHKPWLVLQHEFVVTPDEALLRLQT